MKRRHLAWALLVAVAVVTVVAIVASAITSAVNSQLIRDQQVSNTTTLDNTDRTLRLMEDCTIPTGECYQRSQQRTAAAVADIGRVTVLAAACAASLDGHRLDVPARAARIEACIVEQLDEP